MATRRRTLWRQFGLALLMAASCSHLTTLVAPISDQEFERLSVDLSEAPGYFDTDNLISNETSYQHVIPKLLELTRPGQAYIGVGPDQNFTYIAAVKPGIAFVVDVRRDNLLQHLFLKQIFEMAETRTQYLALLLGRRLPAGLEREDDETRTEGETDALVRAARQIDPDAVFFEENFAQIWMALVRRFPLLVQEGDRPIVKRMARAFFERGLDLKFASHGRSPRAIYPTFERLLAETDLRGVPHNFLSSDQRYRFVRQMQLENRIVPVIGDLAGDSALRRIAEQVELRGLVVSAFYTSNVEFYLFAGHAFGRFVENVKRLPVNKQSHFIRSYFSYWREPHPESVPGFFVTSLLQPIERFLEVEERRPSRTYQDVVWSDYVPVATEKRSGVP